MSRIPNDSPEAAFVAQASAHSDALIQALEGKMRIVSATIAIVAAHETDGVTVRLYMSMPSGLSACDLDGQPVDVRRVTLSALIGAIQNELHRGVS